MAKTNISGSIDIELVLEIHKLANAKFDSNFSEALNTLIKKGLESVGGGS